MIANIQMSIKLIGLYFVFSRYNIWNKFIGEPFKVVSISLKNYIPNCLSIFNFFSSNVRVPNSKEPLTATTNLLFSLASFNASESIKLIASLTDTRWVGDTSSIFFIRSTSSNSSVHPSSSFTSASLLS